MWDMKELNINYWNSFVRSMDNEDVASVAKETDIVIENDGYLFLLQGVGELNNLCVVKCGASKNGVINSVREVFLYLLERGINCITVMVGQKHKTYQLLYHFFNKENVVNNNGIYFAYLESKEWLRNG